MINLNFLLFNCLKIDFKSLLISIKRSQYNNFFCSKLLTTNRPSELVEIKSMYEGLNYFVVF